MATAVDLKAFAFEKDATKRKDIKRAAKVFKALSHPGRLALICRLSGGEPVTQTELVRELGWPQSTVARYLLDLRATGLVKAERQGAEVRLELGGPVALDLLNAMCAWVHPETGEQLSADFGRQIPKEAS